MFSNQLSARELFNNGSQSQSTQDRMMPSDFSQIQNAQMTQLEYSMANSQDFFSQDQYSSGSGVGYVSNRPSAIDKYIAKQAKPSLFRTNSQNKITVGRPPSTISGPGMERKSHVPPSNYMETLNMMKTKTKEREERDMLSSIVSIVQECSDEVKSNLSSMKINDKDHCETLKSSFASLTHSLDESSKKILTAVKQKHDIDSEIAVLRKELRQKDEKIYQLQQKQTNKDDSVDNSSTLLDSLKSFLVEQQTKTSHSLQKVLEHTQEQLKQIKEFTSDHRNGLEENNKHIKDLKYSSAGHVQDIEKRLVNELVSLRDDFDHQKRDMENFLRSHINSNQQKHNRDLEKHIQKGLTEGLQQSVEKQQEFFYEKHNELEKFCKSQNRMIENYIKTASAAQTKELKGHNQDNHKEISQKVDLVLSNQNDNRDENSNHFNEIQKSIDVFKNQPQQSDTVPQTVQDRIDELHTFYQSEIKRLRAEIDSKKIESNVENSKEPVQENVLQNVYNSKSDEDRCNKKDAIRTRSQAGGSIFKNRSTFLSPKPPKVTWNSRAIFSRANPSPVATVRPQIQQAQNTITERSAEQAVQAFLPVTATRSQRDSVDNLQARNNVISNGNNNSIQISGHVQEQNCDNINAVGRNNPVKGRGGRKGKKRGRKCKTTAKNSAENTTQNVTENKDLNENQPKSCAVGMKGNMMVRRSNETLARKVTSVKPISNMNSTLYDFQDEASPVPPLRQRNTFSNPHARKMDVVQAAVCESSSEDESSASTSSVWSISDVFERKQVTHCASSPDSQHLGDTPDFFSSPSLMEISCEMNKQVCNTEPFNQVVQEQPSSQVRKQKRKLYNCYDMTMMQFVKRKTRKY